MNSPVHPAILPTKSQVVSAAQSVAHHAIPKNAGGANQGIYTTELTASHAQRTAIHVSEGFVHVAKVTTCQVLFVFSVRVVVLNVMVRLAAQLVIHLII